MVKYSKKLMDPATKADSKLVQKTAEETGDLVGNKTSDEITSAGKRKIR